MDRDALSYTLASSFRMPHFPLAKVVVHVLLKFLFDVR